MEVVTIVISPTGEAEVKVTCVAGKKCSAVSKAIEEALGSRTKDVATADMHKKEVASVRASR